MKGRQKMKRGAQMDKIEYEVPKLVDLMIEQQNTHGSAGCAAGGAYVSVCISGSGASGGCSAGAGA
jgi:hypothetical protein